VELPPLAGSCTCFATSLLLRNRDRFAGMCLQGHPFHRCLVAPRVHNGHFNPGSSSSISAKETAKAQIVLKQAGGAPTDTNRPMALACKPGLRSCSTEGLLSVLAQDGAADLRLHDLAQRD